MFYTHFIRISLATASLLAIAACTSDSSSASSDFGYDGDYFPDMSQNRCVSEKVSDSKVTVVMVVQGNIYDSIVYNIGSGNVVIEQNMYVTPLASNQNFQDLCDELKESSQDSKIKCEGRYIHSKETVDAKASPYTILANAQQKCDDFYMENPVIEKDAEIQIPSNRNSCFVTKDTDTDFQMIITEVNKKTTTMSIKNKSGNLETINLIQYDPSVSRDTVDRHCSAAKAFSEINEEVNCGDDFIRIYSRTYGQLKQQSDSLKEQCSAIQRTGLIYSNNDIYEPVIPEIQDTVLTIPALENSCRIEQSETDLLYMVLSNPDTSTTELFVAYENGRITIQFFTEYAPNLPQDFLEQECDLAMKEAIDPSTVSCIENRITSTDLVTGDLDAFTGLSDAFKEMCEYP